MVRPPGRCCAGSATPSGTAGRTLRRAPRTRRHPRPWRVLTRSRCIRAPAQLLAATLPRSPVCVCTHGFVPSGARRQTTGPRSRDRGSARTSQGSPAVRPGTTFPGMRTSMLAVGMRAYRAACGLHYYPRVGSTTLRTCRAHRHATSTGPAWSRSGGRSRMTRPGDIGSARISIEAAALIFALLWGPTLLWFILRAVGAPGTGALTLRGWA